MTIEETFEKCMLRYYNELGMTLNQAQQLITEMKANTRINLEEFILKYCTEHGMLLNQAQQFVIEMKMTNPAFMWISSLHESWFLKSLDNIIVIDKIGNRHTLKLFLEQNCNVN
jgi:hypothetical protein